MSPYQLFLALLGFLAFVAVMPAWIWFLTSHPSAQSLPVQARFLAGLVLPSTALLFAVSWLQPG